MLQLPHVGFDIEHKNANDTLVNLIAAGVGWGGGGVAFLHTWWFRTLI